MNDDKRALTEAEDLNEALGRLLGTADGKRVMFWVLSMAAPYGNAFAQSDATERYLLGRQSIGQEIIARMGEIDERTYPRLLLEAGEMREMDRVAREAKARASEPEDGDDQYA